jgi:hypothetical protein
MTHWTELLGDYYGQWLKPDTAGQRWFAELHREFPKLTEDKLAAIIKARGKEARERYGKPTLADVRQWVKPHYAKTGKDRDHYERNMRDFLELAEGLDEVPERPRRQITAVIGQAGYEDFERRRKKGRGYE